MLRSYLNKIFSPKAHKSNNFINIIGENEKFLNKDNDESFNVYNKNVIVYRCVNLISQSASHVPWIVFIGSKKGKKLPLDHAIYKLLHRPNPEKAGADFFTEIISSKLLFGNAYILSTNPKNPISQEIYYLHPQNVEIVFNKNSPIAYKHTYGNNISKLYYIDQISKQSQILHIKSYNPANMHYGISCISAAKMQIELHNQATRWNKSLLQNGARPSGALVVDSTNGYLTDEQFERLQSQLYEKFSSSHNAGKPLLLEGGLNWQEMSINPKDMDFIESKNSAAREIALAFGVPPQLLGINGDNTYNNMQEARLALWEETLIPLLDKISDALSNWFSYLYEQDIIIDFDRDSISALTEKRENLWSKISSADFMTINEKREFFGLSPIPNGDILRNNHNKD